MMDAVKFVKTLGRMCNAECIRCEFWKRKSSGESCTSWQKTHPEEAVAIAEKWAAEHPAKTRQSEFLKLFPNAQTDSGCLNACPMDVFGNTGIDCNKRTCFECKKEFWLAEVEDA